MSPAGEFEKFCRMHLRALYSSETYFVFSPYGHRNKYPDEFVFRSPHHTHRAQKYYANKPKGNEPDIGVIRFSDIKCIYDKGEKIVDIKSFYIDKMFYEQGKVHWLIYSPFMADKFKERYIQNPWEDHNSVVILNENVKGIWRIFDCKYWNSKIKQSKGGADIEKLNADGEYFNSEEVFLITFDDYEINNFVKYSDEILQPFTYIDNAKPRGVEFYKMKNFAPIPRSMF